MKVINIYFNILFHNEVFFVLDLYLYFVKYDTFQSGVLCVLLYLRQPVANRL